jgi:hypothetical protein
MYQNEPYRDHLARKKPCIYNPGLRLLTTEDFQTVKFFLSLINLPKDKGLNALNLDLPKEAQLVRDKAYNNDLYKVTGIKLSPFCKKNSKRPVPPWSHSFQFHYRKMIETTGSLLGRLLPREIHAPLQLILNARSSYLFWLVLSITYSKWQIRSLFSGIDYQEIYY